jgi:hypothetical protein
MRRANLEGLVVADFTRARRKAFIHDIVAFLFGENNDSLYLPIVRIIRERNVLAHFPSRTEADLYIWIIDHLHYLKEQYGPDFSPEAATDDFTRQFSRKRVKVLQRGVKRAVARVSHTVAHIIHR